MKSLPTSYTAARKWGIILLLALASLGAALLSMSFGSPQLPFSEILTALMGGETQAYNIVVYARLPHTLAALLCGRTLAQAIQIAADFTADSIQKSDPSREKKYGVRFEAALPGLMKALNLV